MKALICPQQLIKLSDGTDVPSVADIHPTGFPVAEPFFWVEWPDDADRSTHYWNGEAVVLKPVQIVEQPITSGPNVIA